MELLDVENVVKTPDMRSRYWDCIKIEGFVEITNGDTKIKAKNKFVNPMLCWLADVFACWAFVDATNHATNDWDIYLGTDQTTATSGTTTALTTPIGTAPGTAPNTRIGSTYNPSTGVYRVVYNATWNAGTVSGTVGEIALYLQIYSTLRDFGATVPASGTKQLTSRLAVADGTMTAFAINTAVPLTVSWQIQASFS